MGGSTPGASRGVALAMFSFAWLLAAGGSGAAQPRVCRVETVQGEVVLIHAGGQIGVTSNMTLSINDQLRTGASGRLEIVCDDQVRFTLGAETEIGLGRLTGEKGNRSTISMSLHQGIARFVAPVRTWGSLRIRGPVAVASVRQTEWIMEAPGGATNVFVVSGRVAVAAKHGRPVELAAGDGVDVAADGTMAVPRKWGAKRVEDVRNRLGLR